MVIIRKLKPDRSAIGLVPVVATLIATAAVWAAFGLRPAIIFVTAAFMFFSFLVFVAYLRTTNIGYLVNALFIFFAGLVGANLPSGFLRFDRAVLALCFFLAAVFFGWTVYLMVTRKYKWRGREILELAAAPVDEPGDGFTERPRPSGKIEYSKGELLGFAQFALKNLIAMPFIDTNRVILIPATLLRAYLHLFGLRPDLSRDTWVSLDFEGRVSVNISKKDYYNYTENLSFDQLCESLGNVFVEFLEMYKKGEAVRIIDRLNAIRENPFT
jgi:hypothetical protein